MFACKKYVLVVFVAFISCTERQPRITSWQLIFQNDLNGKTLYGSRKALCDALKSGSPIRVSWGEKLQDGTSCIEFAEPHFTTLMNDSNIVVQFPGSLIQTSYTDPAKSFLATKPASEWHALMSTDGHYHQFHTEIGSERILRVMYLRANMSWYAFVEHENNRAVEKPLALDLPQGIVLDSIIKN